MALKCLYERTLLKRHALLPPMPLSAIGLGAPMCEGLTPPVHGSRRLSVSTGMITTKPC
jgi:hypothetical protein